MGRGIEAYLNFEKKNAIYFVDDLLAPARFVSLTIIFDKKIVST